MPSQERIEYLAGLLDDYADGLEGHWVIGEDDTKAFISDLREAATALKERASATNSKPAA